MAISFTPTQYSAVYHCNMRPLPEDEGVCRETNMTERACSTTVSRPLGEVTPLHIETSTRCHHCTLNMGDERYSVPISYDAVTNTYRSYGCFCSLNCCKAYIQERNDPLLTSFLSSTLSALYGLRMEDLNASPPRNALALYGGSLSESEYNECKTAERVCLHTEPLVPTFSTLCRRP